MVGDGKTGDNSGDDNNGPESDTGAPSSRRRQGLLANAAAARSGELQANAARVALEREVHRFQTANRHGRLKRKPQRVTKAGSPEEKASSTQPKDAAGRTSAVTSSKSKNQAASPLEDAAAPASLRGSSQAPFQARADSQVETGEPHWAARWQGPTPGASYDPLDSTEHQETGSGSETETAPDERDTAAESDAAPSRRKKRKQRKSSADSIANSVLLPVVRAKWQTEVAAFGGRREAPLRPYCPTDYAEAFELTADERRAIPKERIRHPNTKIGKLVTRVLGAFAALEPWLDELTALPVDVEKIVRIPTYIRSLSHADAQLAPAVEMLMPEFLAPGETMMLTRQEVVQRLLQLALTARRCLLSQVKSMIALGRITPGVVGGLTGGNGHYNTAKDVLSLIELVRRAVGCGATSGIPEDDLERYTLLAYKLIETSSLTAPNGGRAARTLAKQERSRAYTLLWLAYREAQRALTFIFWDMADVGIILPTLVVGAGRKPKR